MSAEKLSSDKVPHKFAEWLLGMGCPAEKVPSIDKMSQMCRGQYYMIWRSLMEHVQPKDSIRQKRLQVFFNDVHICQEKKVFNECDAGIVPEELKLWKQQKELQEQVAEVESRIAVTLKSQQELHDKIMCKIGQRNLTYHQIKDLQRRTWMLQQVSDDLATKKANLQETKSISDSLCSFENVSDVQSKVEKCLSLSHPSQLPIPNPVASSSIVSSETDNNQRDENIMSLVKCRGDALWPPVLEARAAAGEALARENNTHKHPGAPSGSTPHTVLAHTAALHASLAVLVLKNRLQLTHTRERFAAAIEHLNNYISGEFCELLVLRCERARSEARVGALQALLVELAEGGGVFCSEKGSDHAEASPGKIAAIDKCIVNTRDELKRLISCLATTERKINNVKDCLINVFNSFHNNTAVDDERIRGVQIDFPKEPVSVLKQFYMEKCMKIKNQNISLELEVSNCSYNEAIDNPRFVDELRFYLNKFNLEKNRKLVLDSGDKIWIFETLKSLSSNLYKEWAINDSTLLCPSVTLSCSFRQLIDDVQNINVLESIIKQLNTTDTAGFSIDINSKINKEEMVLDRTKKCMSENSNLLSKINKTLDISREDLQFWSEVNLKKYISSTRTVNGKSYKDYEQFGQRNLTYHQIKDLQRRTWMLQQVSDDLATKKANLQETKSISDSLCSFENVSDVQSKVEKCLSLSHPSQLPIPNPVASSSIVSSETDNNQRDENIMSLVKCRGDALWPPVLEARAAAGEALARENNTHKHPGAPSGSTPHTVLAHTAALHASLAVLVLKNRLQLTHTRERFAAAIEHLNNYISGEFCELLVLRCERARSEARVGALQALLVELAEGGGVFCSEKGSDHAEASPGKIAAIDKCIVNTRDELKRLISCLATTERKINNVKDCLINVFNSFHNNTAVDDERIRGVQIDFPKEPVSVLKQFYMEKCMKIKNQNISLELEVSNCSYNEAIDNPRFVDELRFYLNKFNLEKNRKLVLDSGDKIWIFETLKSLSSNLYKEWAINDSTLLCPSVTLSCSFRQLIDDVQNINVLESIIKQLNTTDTAGFSIDINSKINKEEMVLDRTKICMSENSNLLSKINKTLDISREDLQFWSEVNLKKYISSTRTVNGKSYKDYEQCYLENIMLRV